MSSTGAMSFIFYMDVPDFLPFGSLLRLFAARQLFLQSTWIACCFCNQENNWGTAADLMRARAGES